MLLTVLVCAAFNLAILAGLLLCLILGGLKLID
jgi:hypothetical protein